MITQRYGFGYSVELEPEVRDWLEQLPTDQFARAAFYVDLLAANSLLGEPYTRQLDRAPRTAVPSGSAGGADHLLDASGRRIVLLTVFIKTQMREDREIERARRALARCIAEEHEVAEESEKR